MVSIENVLGSLTKVINLSSFVPLSLPDNLQIISAEILRLLQPAHLEIMLVGEQGGNCPCGESPAECPVLKDVLLTVKFNEREPDACSRAAGYGRAFACLPLVGGKEVFGLLTVSMPEGGALTRGDLETLLVFTNFIGITVQRDRILKRLETEKQGLMAANGHLGELANSLIRSEKLAAAGRIAADLAHEINNPLGIISARAECILLEQGENLAEDVQEDLKAIVKQAGRVGKISRALLNMARIPEQRDGQIVDVQTVINEVISLVRTTLLQKGVSLRYEEEQTVLQVRADIGHLQQVLFNLVWNALDAMPLGGELVLRLFREGTEVKIQVADSGPGVPFQEQEKIFTPFYTTKPAGQGTGLGLSISSRMVEGWGGHLNLKHSGDAGNAGAGAAASSKDQGACFEIVIPALGTPEE